ncbi:IclR family transcriptional regulator [Rhodopseudomonas pseudopalustris]|uniref:Transcriptional regulator, IclR family n=1 Tax=Rhodopseudomonas pseudopalustris TaxID=1513892 RepID=A0A1H8W963_9BRAD|nr:IclR family transcriptional regulator [Rhodopseudomonas pseudopalustris]SEP24169.1 transcriptional regulator, IclR family [Rhodopseudomonas pseudopalustris]
MIVRQAANVLEILEYFARVKKPATLAEIADHFGWPRSSTFNLLTTLADKGYLYEPRPRAGYYPTPRWLVLAREVSEVEPLPAWSRALITSLSSETGETVAIAAPAGVMAVFIDVIESSAAIRYFAHIGHRVPIHATSSGRALLLQYSQDERDSLYRKIEFKQYNPSTPISIDAVEAELSKSVERGYCQSFADYSRDLAGVAVPLPIGERRLSVVVAGPEFRIGDRTAEIAATLKQSVERFRGK